MPTTLTRPDTSAFLGFSISAAAHSYACWVGLLRCLWHGHCDWELRSRCPL